MAVTVRAGSPRDAHAMALLESSHRLMQSLFAMEYNHFLSVDALCDRDIAFFVAEEDGRILGCVALKRLDGYGEIKSMFTDPEVRGRGIATALMRHLEEVARAESLPLLRLETGDLLHDAHRLYARQGFGLCDPFGNYSASPASIFMEKALG